MTHLDLFSGIGGFSLGLEWASLEFKTVAFCEKDKKCQLVLKKHWPNVPVYGDIKELTLEKLKEDGIKTIDIITGGFPCQPFSCAGKQKGKDDDRYLWPEMFRIVKEIRSTWVVVENVPGIINMELDNVLTDLESIGYATRPFNIPACAVGARHIRKRIWIIARNTNENIKIENKEIQKKQDTESFRICGDVPNLHQQHDDDRGYGTGEVCLERSQKTKIQRGKPNVSNTQGERDVRRYGGFRQIGENKERGLNYTRRKNNDAIREWWQVEPDVDRVVDGVPGRVDRLKQLGNAVVPQIPYLIGQAIMEVEKKVILQSQSIV